MSKINKTSQNSKIPTDLSSFTGRNSDGTWKELDFKVETSISDEAFIALLAIGSTDSKAAQALDNALQEQRKPHQEKVATIQHNCAVALLKRHPIAKGDWLSIPVGRVRWTAPVAFPALCADLVSFNAAFTMAGFKETNVRKIQERVLNKARAMAFERDFDMEAHAAITACFNTLARLSTDTKGTLAEKLWGHAENVFATGAGLIPDATRKAILADTMARMEEKESEAEKKANAKSAKANSNTTPKVSGAMVG